MAFQFNEILLSHSSQTLLNGCAQKYKFRKVILNGKREPGNLATECGHALHKGIQTYLATRDEDRAIAAFMFRYPIDFCTNENDGRSIEACLSTLEAMISQVDIEQYELASIQCKDGKVRPAIEVPFRINLLGGEAIFGRPIRIAYRGFIDAILWHLLEQKHIVTDVKTTIDARTDPLVKFWHSEQTVPYGLVLEYMEGKIIDKFDALYFNAVISLLEPKISFPEFHKSRDLIQDWIKGVIVDLNNIAMFERSNFWPKKSSHCIAYNRKCEFFDVCDYRDDALLKQLMLTDEMEKGPIDEIVANNGDVVSDPWIEFDMDLFPKAQVMP